MEKILILGAGGHGKVVADLAEACGYEVAGFLDDTKEPGTVIMGDLKVLGPIKSGEVFLSDIPNAAVGIGSNKWRVKFGSDFREMGFHTPALIHPKACVSKYASVGVGSICVGGAVVNPMAEIGLDVIVNTGATVDHDCVIKDGVHIAPGANLSGTVTVGGQTWVGVGATVRENMVIGSGCMIGAGTAVVTDIPDNVLVLGVPGKVVKSI